MTTNLPTSMTSKIQQTESHWWWLGAHSRGYGYWWDPDRKRMVPAHRALYERLNGPVDEEQDLDHLCRNRGCVNPGHLEPVTRGENIRRGDGPAIIRERQLAKTHCKRGHPYSGDNLYINPRGQRECKECRRIAREASRVR